MLTCIDVSRNSLQGLPPEIKLLHNLVKLIALSNHLRLHRIPLEELSSLQHLRLLDLRYNSKLKQSALDILKEGYYQQIYSWIYFAQFPHMTELQK